MSLKRLFAVVFSLTIVVAARAQFTTVAYEGFNYSAGSLAGQNGGTGWSSAWINDYTPGVSFSTITTGMSYSGLTTTGGSITWASGGNGLSEDSRTLPLLDSGVVYVQFLGQFGSSSGAGTPNLRLLDSGALTGGFGGNGGTHGSVVSILDTTLQPATDGSSSSFASLANLNLVVARIDYQADTTTMWINPNLTTFNYDSPSSPDATYAGLAPAFNAISFVSRSPASVDEITIMAEPAPEPSTASLLLIGAGLLAYGAQRRGAFRRG
jgi:PEP-CTERM motif